LSEIVQAEPSADLFTVPADYKKMVVKPGTWWPWCRFDPRLTVRLPRSSSRVSRRRFAPMAGAARVPVRHATRPALKQPPGGRNARAVQPS